MNLLSNPRKAFAAVMLIGGIGLLQYHAILFWTNVVDPLTGWAWSLLLEGAALWCWSHPRLSVRSLGAVATLLVLAGPLYQVSAPLVEEHMSVNKTAQQRKDLQAEITGLEASLNTYLANSEKRVGWAGRIDEAQAQLTAARSDLRNLTAAAPQRMEWQRQAIIIMQAIALILFQLLNVIMIRTLSAGANVAIGKQQQAHSRPRVAVVKTARAAAA